MKAAGGINNYKLTTNIIAAGVEKIGSSNPLPIIDELNHVAGNQKVAPGTVKGPRLI
jgi:deoxyribose-phosphate aldolase